MGRPIDTARVTDAVRPAPRAWTAAEEATLREHYGAHGPAWCAAALRRTKRSVISRAFLLGLGHSLWTDEELQRLRLVWGDVGERALREKFPGRTMAAIVMRAQRLGLPSPSQGLVSLHAAAVRAGLGDGQLRAVLDEAGVEIHRRVRLGYRRSRSKGQYRQRLVDLDAALDAVRAWLARRAARLTLAQACARFGEPFWIVSRAMRRLARARPVEGLPLALHKSWSVRAEDVAAAIAQHRDPSRSWRVPGRCVVGACALGTAGRTS